MLTDLAKIAQSFAPLAGLGELPAVTPLEGGNINTSWQLTVAGNKRWVLQRLNGKVFSDPEASMNNALQCAYHLKAKTFPHQLPDFASAGSVHWVWDAGSLWRLYPFLDGEMQLTPKPAAAYQAARAFGRLAGDLADLPPSLLQATLPGLHNLERHLVELELAASADVCGRLEEAYTTVAAVQQHSELAELPQRERLPLRVVHADAKIANLLFTPNGDEEVVATNGDEEVVAANGDEEVVAAILDLDTFMPGYLFYDFGDLMRSCGAQVMEDDAKATFNLSDEMIRALVQGYLAGLEGRLDDAELASLGWAAAYVSCTLAVRFVTDYLAGDVYFRTQYAQQNLNSAKTQLRFLEGFLAAQDRIARSLAPA